MKPFDNFRPIFLVCFTMSAIFIIYNLHMFNKRNILPMYNPPRPEAVIRVHYYKVPEWVSPDVFRNCNHNCTLTWGPDSYNDSDVVLFHGPYIYARTIPPRKMPGQIWVLHTKESPAGRYTEFSKWKWLFNWTMTYQRDADVLALYGGFIKKPEIKENSEQPKLKLPINSYLGNYSVERNWTSSNNKAAWFVSNCRTSSQREIFVKALSNHVDVDIYGTCGQYKCSRSKESTCIDILREKYKSYLSFENSLCRDYVTEKSFKIYNNFLNVIPITRGIGDQYSLFLPPGSFINTNKCTSVKKFGEYLKEVMQNKEEFSEYFKWRRHYSSSWHFPREFCELCRKLHEGPAKYQRIYENVGSFVNGNTYKPYCNEADDIT